MKYKYLYVILIIIVVITLIYLKQDNTLVVNKEINQNIFSSHKYYLEKNLDRYQIYYSTHPDLDIDRIIAIVNVNRDNQEYEHINSSDITKENTILVNKYNYLNNDYIPNDLVDIDIKYAYRNRQIKAEVYNAFIEMYNDALNNNINLLIISGYRNYDYQNYLYSNCINIYGVDYANKVCAKAGYSEHQTGLALDIITPNINMNEFENTEAYQWLKENCYNYGFILRYPKDKMDITGYVYEPWHYRYVGKDIALQIKKENITFDEYYAFYIDN